jgi:hypothetical protein
MTFTVILPMLGRANGRDESSKAMPGFLVDCSVQRALELNSGEVVSGFRRLGDTKSCSVSAPRLR